MSVIFRSTDKNGHLIRLSKNIYMNDSFIKDTMKQGEVFLYNFSSDIFRILDKYYLLHFINEKNGGFSSTQWYLNQDIALDEFSNTSHSSSTHHDTNFNVIPWDEVPTHNEYKKIVFQLSEDIQLEVDSFHIESLYKYENGNIYILKATTELPMLVLVQFKDKQKYSRFYNDVLSVRLHQARSLGPAIIELSEVGYTPNNYKELVSLTGLTPVDFRNTFGIPESTFSQHRSGSRGLSWQGWNKLVNDVRDYLTLNLNNQNPLFDLKHKEKKNQRDDNNERYFYIVWKLRSDSDNQIHGVLHTTINGKFFNPEYVFKDFKENLDGIQIVDWKEFNSRDDYEDFSKSFKEYWTDLM